MTVKDLIQELGHYPLDATVICAGSDNGGYDWTWKKDASISIEKGMVFLQGEGEDYNE